MLNAQLYLIFLIYSLLEQTFHSLSNISKCQLLLLLRLAVQQIENETDYCNLSKLHISNTLFITLKE